MTSDVGKANLQWTSFYHCCTVEDDLNTNAIYCKSDNTKFCFCIFYLVCNFVFYHLETQESCKKSLKQFSTLLLSQIRPYRFFFCCLRFNSSKLASLVNACEYVFVFPTTGTSSGKRKGRSTDRRGGGNMTQKGQRR